MFSHLVTTHRAMEQLREFGRAYVRCWRREEEPGLTSSNSVSCVSKSMDIFSPEEEAPQLNVFTKDAQKLFYQEQ